MTKLITVFSYGVEDYEYDRTSCTGRCDDYCRCTRIIDAQVKKIGAPLSSVYLRTKKVDAGYWESGTVRVQSVIEQYAIDRLFRIHKLYDTDNWELKISGGYYGEECDGSQPLDHVRNAFERDVLACLDMPLLDVVKFLLEKEYDTMHKSIEHVTHAEIVELDPRGLTRQEEHFSRAKREAKDSYGLTDGIPVGIVYEGSRLIDGYHRTSLVSGPQSYINIW